MQQFVYPESIGYSVIVVVCAVKNSEKMCLLRITVFCTTKSAKLGGNLLQQPL
jgi:hypothetical protein